MNKKIKNNSFDNNFSEGKDENNQNDEDLNSLSFAGHASETEQDDSADENDIEMSDTSKYNHEKIAEKVEGVTTLPTDNYSHCLHADEQVEEEKKGDGDVDGDVEGDDSSDSDGHDNKAAAAAAATTTTTTIADNEYNISDPITSNNSLISLILSQEFMQHSIIPPTGEWLLKQYDRDITIPESDLVKKYPSIRNWYSKEGIQLRALGRTFQIYGKIMPVCGRCLRVEEKVGIKEDVSLEQGIKDVIIEQQPFEIRSAFEMLKDNKKNDKDDDNEDHNNKK